jgi:SAM-dependent methyltransferase
VRNARKREQLSQRLPHSAEFDAFQDKIDAEHENRIGRITEGLLVNISKTVDIVEPIAKFSDNLKGKEGVGQIFNAGLEDWSPAQSDEVKYDLIWNQWCLGHLTDAQLVVYLEKCGKALKEGGLVVVKENLSTNEEDVFDELDSSVTRYVLGKKGFDMNADSR